MFPDSQIAQNFGCAETKSRYLATFGIAPFFKSMLQSKVKSSSEYVLLFDESLNKEIKKKKLDVHVRFWEADRVQTQYVCSQFMGHTYPSTLYDVMEPILTDLGYSKLVQLSMDGPNVNWKVDIFFSEYL